MKRINGNSISEIAGQVYADLIVGPNTVKAIFADKRTYDFIVVRHYLKALPGPGEKQKQTVDFERLDRNKNRYIFLGSFRKNTFGYEIEKHVIQQMIGERMADAVKEQSVRTGWPVNMMKNEEAA